MKTGLPDNHYSLICIPDVAEICNPFFQKFGLKNFIHARMFDNGTCYALLADEKQHKHHFEKKYLLTPPIPPQIFGQKFVYLLTGNEDGPFQQALHDFRNLFNLWYPFFLIERHYGYYDLNIFFAPPHHYDIVNTYINNLDAFKNFKFIFKEKATKLIKQSEKNLIIIPDAMRPNFGGLKDYQSKKVILTPREIQSLRHIALSHTLKETARALNISPRTAEYHINNIKIKLGIRRKSEILDAINHYDLGDLIT